VSQRRRALSFLYHALRTGRIVVKSGSNSLERDPTLERRIFSDIDLAHPTAAEAIEHAKSANSGADQGIGRLVRRGMGTCAHGGKRGGYRTPKTASDAEFCMGTKAPFSLTNAENPT
jgi:hypothetical protein